MTTEPRQPDKILRDGQQARVLLEHPMFQGFLEHERQVV